MDGKHPDYGPCDSFAGGLCSECVELGVEKPPKARPRLENIWQGVGPLNMKSIRLDWSNDRHHEVVIQGRGEVDDVADALRYLAALIDNDPHLRQ